MKIYIYFCDILLYIFVRSINSYTEWFMVPHGDVYVVLRVWEYCIKWNDHTNNTNIRALKYYELLFTNSSLFLMLSFFFFLLCTIGDTISGTWFCRRYRRYVCFPIFCTKRIVVVYSNFIPFIFQKKYVEASTGIFRPVPPFGSILSTVPSNAIYFGSILGVQRFCCKSLELLRRKEDIGNEIFGFAMIYPYYHYFLNHSEHRLIRHNRIIGGSVALCIIYANFLAWVYHLYLVTYRYQDV